MPPDTTDEERQQQLPQDNTTPAQPAAPSPDPGSGVMNDPLASAQSDSTLDDTHPATDTNIDATELHDEGVSGAAEAAEPNAGNATTGFTPPAQDGTGSVPPEEAANDQADDDSSGGVVVG